MRFPLTPDEEAFRQERAGVLRSATAAAALPKRSKLASISNARTMSAGSKSWPQAAICAVRGRSNFGGKGWSALQSYLFDEECSLAGAPWLLPFGVNYVGPVIFEFGNQDQVERYLPGILDASTFWCQGYSEPDAGSDLASLKTRAVRDGDHYIVNGAQDLDDDGPLGRPHLLPGADRH